MKPGIHRDLAIESYHRGPGVSRSTLMKLENGTPKDLRWYMDNPPTETPAMLLGSAVDAMVFEPEVFAAEWAVEPKVDRRTKAGKEAAAAFAAQAEGKIIIPEPMYEEAVALADAVKNAKSVRGLMDDADPQVSFFWDEDGQLVKARPDGFDFGRGVSFDLKSTPTLDDVDLARSTFKYGYDVQAACNAVACAKLGIKWKAHVIIWVRKSDPIDVRCTVFELGDDWMTLGESRFYRLLARYRKAMREQTWEGHDVGVGKLPMPKWVAYELERSEEAERAEGRDGEA